MTVIFCGHSEVSNPEEIKKKLTRIIEDLISEGATTFLLGGYGAFDSLAARSVKELKSSHPEVRSILVIPYLDREYDLTLYDESEYPPIENVPKRFAISKRNEWMIDQADMVISGVTHDWGGAAKTLKYAERKKKKIISTSAES